MRVLIAEDDAVSRRLLETVLTKWGFEPVTTVNGREALAQLQAPDAPRLAILDWMMPELDGVEVVRLLRAEQRLQHTHVILLTARGRLEDIVGGLRAGADDYLTKPFEREELRARLEVGARIVGLQTQLAQRVVELQTALEKVKLLHGLLPICSYCKKIRDDQNYWQQVEEYIGHHSEAEFSHGICPDCYSGVVQPQLDKLEAQRQIA